MVKVYKLHKLLGISAGVILLILSVSGFFLNHNKWSFLYTTTFSNVPSHIKSSELRVLIVEKIFLKYHLCKYWQLFLMIINFT